MQFTISIFSPIVAFIFFTYVNLFLYQLITIIFNFLLKKI